MTCSSTIKERPNLGLQVLLAHLVPQDPKVTKAYKEFKVNQVLKVNKEFQGCPVIQVNKEFKVNQVLKVNKEFQGCPVLQAHQELLFIPLFPLVQATLQPQTIAT
jgi:hypothetical protein